MHYKIIIKDLFLDAFWEALYFPVWWYREGLRKTFFFCLQKIKDAWKASGLKIFLVNFFKPMFGTRGWDAYVLSLASHFVQVIWRLILLILWFSFWILVFLLWVLLPLIIIWQLIVL